MRLKVKFFIYSARFTSRVPIDLKQLQTESGLTLLFAPRPLDLDERLQLGSSLTRRTKLKTQAIPSRLCSKFEVVIRPKSGEYLVIGLSWFGSPLIVKCEPVTCQHPVTIRLRIVFTIREARSSSRVVHGELMAVHRIATLYLRDISHVLAFTREVDWFCKSPCETSIVMDAI